MLILLILNFSYHQKVPYDPPDLEVKDKTFGLVAPEEYALPTTAPLWTPVAYAAFDVAMEDKNEKEKKKVCNYFWPKFKTIYIINVFLLNLIASSQLILSSIHYRNNQKMKTLNR